MNAADIRNTIGEIAPLVEIIKRGKQQDRDWANTQSALGAKKMNSLLASMKQGINGARMLTGALSQQQGILQGNLGNCRRHLLTCDKKEVTELGESEGLPPAPWRTPTETAREEWARKHKEQIPGVQRVKKSNPESSEKYTASEEYANDQKGPGWDSMTQQPGMRMSHDRLPAAHLNGMVAEAANLINQAKRLNKVEDQQDQKQVAAANKAAVSAMMDTYKAETGLAAMDKPVTAAEALKHMKQIGGELQTCMKEVLAKCGSQPFQAAYPASTVKAVLSPMSHPRDKPEYKPDVMKPKKEDKAITP